ncbi:TPA: tyrosine-type recombinase/integrase [Clostridioides difficile]
MKGGVRKKGKKWYYYFDLGVIDGKRKKVERAGGNTKKDAEKALREALKEYENTGIMFDECEMNLAEYLDFWFNEYVILNCKYNTQESYRIHIQTHIKPALGHYKLKSLTPATLQNFINAKFRSNYSQSTLEVIRAILKKALKSAVYPYQFLKDNPMQYITIPKNETIKKEIKVITLEEFNNILNLFNKGTYQYISLMIAFHTGMRKGEVAGLTWEDVNLKTKTIDVNHTMIKKKKGDIELATPKSSSSYRTITIGDTLVKALKEHRKYQNENKLLFGEFYINNNFVCTKINGNPININSISTMCNSISRKLNTNFSFHSLRHTHATMLLEAGANIKAVQKRLGHSNIAVTMNTYSHVTETMKQETVDLFEKSIK